MSKHDDQLAEAMGDDEFVDAPRKQFAPTHDFAADPVLVGTYKGSREVDTKNGKRLVHGFEVDGQPLDAWGASMLNSRLDGLEDKRVKVILTGELIPTKAGRKVKEYKVLVAKSALAS
jgi:hypothetical protein